MKYKSTPALVSLVVLCFFCVHFKPVSPAVSSKQILSFLAFNKKSEIKTSSVKSLPQANLFLFWPSRLILTSKYISFGNKQFFSFPFILFGYIQSNFLKGSSYNIKMADSFCIEHFTSNEANFARHFPVKGILRYHLDQPPVIYVGN